MLKPIAPLRQSDEEIAQSWTGRVHQPPTDIRRVVFGRRPIPPKHALVPYIPPSRMQRARSALGNAVWTVATVASLTLILLVIAGHFTHG